VSEHTSQRFQLAGAHVVARRDILRTIPGRYPEIPPGRVPIVTSEKQQR